MPKLRNSTTDLGSFTQYLARKCVIHSPQAELDLVGDSREKAPRFGKSEIHEGSQVHMIKPRDSKDEPNTFVAISPKGRAMKVTVEEVNANDLIPELFAAVGD